MNEAQQLTEAELSALALSGRDVPAEWRRVGPDVRRTGNGSLLVALLVPLLGVLGVLWLEMFSVKDGAPGAILFWPGTTEAQAFAAIVDAGGLPIRAQPGVFDDSVVWMAAPAQPDFFARVVAAGALTVMNPLAFGGCSPVVAP